MLTNILVWLYILLFFFFLLTLLQTAVSSLRSILDYSGRVITKRVPGL